MLSIGIVGLPNVGKSTLFNALTRSRQANIQNYPFCTIEPNVGIVNVPDNRLDEIEKVCHSGKIVPTAIKFVDIAGLVKGASQGEGLGNKFLSHIREVDAIIQVVRAFSDPNITHVHNKVDPKADSEVINFELIMADWQTVGKRLEKAKKASKGNKEQQREVEILEQISVHLENGSLASSLELDEQGSVLVKELYLLTAKPMMYVINADENQQLSQEMKDFVADNPYVVISCKLEQELVDFNEEEAKKYLFDLGLEQSGLDKIIIQGYKLLELATFFTSGEPETRAWTIKRNTKAPEAAGVIHTDFIDGFIKAEVINWQDLVKSGGWQQAKESGKLRLEGRDYIMQDGDVCYFHVKTS